MSSEYFAAAVRAYAREVDGQQRISTGRKQKLAEPSLSLISAICAEKDLTERFRLGHYRLFFHGKSKDEGLIVRDDIDDDALKNLRLYVQSSLLADRSGLKKPRVLRRETFLRELLYPVILKPNGRFLGFDMPYLISRLAVGWSKARVSPYTGGFSFTMLQYVNKKGLVQEDTLYPPDLDEAYGQ